MRKVILSSAPVFLSGLVLFLLCTPAMALRVNGKEVEDVYQYILDTLKEDARLQEEYRMQSESNPNFRGVRPYTYSSLSHLSIDDLLYGATQGGLAAVRDMGPDARHDQVQAQAEANIQRVMELFPMLVKDFKAGETLLLKMSIAARKDYMQTFLLSRSRPGYANDSLFAMYWRDEISRNHNFYVQCLSDICDNIYTDTDGLLLSMKLYVETVAEDYANAFNADAGIIKLREAGNKDLAPERVVMDEAIRAQMHDPEAFLKRSRDLAKVRKVLAGQLEDAAHREAPVKELATKLIAEWEQTYPNALALTKDEQEAPEQPPMEDPVIGPEMPAEEEAPTPGAFPKIGIPTLKGF